VLSINENEDENEDEDEDYVNRLKFAILYENSNFVK